MGRLDCRSFLGGDPLLPSSRRVRRCAARRCSLGNVSQLLIRMGKVTITGVAFQQFDQTQSFEHETDVEIIEDFALVAEAKNQFRCFPHSLGESRSIDNRISNVVEDRVPVAQIDGNKADESEYHANDLPPQVHARRRSRPLTGSHLTVQLDGSSSIPPYKFRESIQLVGPCLCQHVSVDIPHLVLPDAEDRLQDHRAFVDVEPSLHEAAISWHVLKECQDVCSALYEIGVDGWETRAMFGFVCFEDA